jgi:hypothetical protein
VWASRVGTLRTGLGEHEPRREATAGRPESPAKPGLSSIWSEGAARQSFCQHSAHTGYSSKTSKFKLCLLLLVSAEGMPSARIFNGLNCQPDVKAHFEQQRVFAALSNLTVRWGDTRCNAPGQFVPDLLLQRNGGIAAPAR